MNNGDKYKFEALPDSSSIPHCIEKPDRPEGPKITPQTKLYITPDQEVFTGNEAERLLLTENDRRYLSENGVIVIDQERWNSAQEFEKKCQMVQGVNNTDDRNIDHQRLFHHYEALADQYFERVIEFGCGPFTNIPPILEQIKRPGQISLLDPLADEYLDHPNCVYQNGDIKGVPVRLIASTIEEFTPEEQYDLVVMINVLEHCYHVPIILDTVTSCLKKNGCFVFADKVLRKEDITTLLANQFDAGHPIKVSEELINGFLDHHFHTVYRREYFGLHDQEHRIDTYFVGLKKGNEGAPELLNMNIKKAKDLLETGFIDPAKNIFRQILKQDPNSAECLNDLGFIAFEEGRTHDAMTYFSRALESDKHFFEAMENMGKCLEYQKKYKEAAEWLERALEFRPEDVSLLNSLGNCLIQDEDIPSAKKIYQRSLHWDDSQEDIKEILKHTEKFERLLTSP
ncbi:MAG: tetratricopeptide repeat protein [Deltaproteobacteria bacterium]|nr:tetratricopeptide repeat protein [Deltaproteobacteria bacterium]